MITAVLDLQGGVEGEVGRFRRNHLVPVPAIATIAELNAFILVGCEADLRRRIVGRLVTVGEAWALERPLLGALPGERFDAAETASPRVDAKSLVTVRQNGYSVPVRLAGLRVSVRIGARDITVSHGGELVARHERLRGRYGTSATLDHYLELLERKPGGLQHSVALRQERERGGWPAIPASDPGVGTSGSGPRAPAAPSRTRVSVVPADREFSERGRRSPAMESPSGESARVLLVVGVRMTLGASQRLVGSDQAVV